LNNTIDQFLDKHGSPFSYNHLQKRKNILPILQKLTDFHQSNSKEYSRFLKIFWNGSYNINDLPFLPVRVFKNHEIKSVSNSDLFKTLNSSGTTGANVSKIILDRATSKRQTKVLSSISKFFLGESRKPMIIIDSLDLIKDRTKFNARAAGILGYSIFGKDHFYALDKNLNPKIKMLKDYLDKHRNEEIFIFSFTFIIWQSLVSYCKQKKIRLDFGNNSILIHGGGWKKLSNKNINNDTFKSEINKYLGIKSIHNYYGMVEQAGSIFMECSKGYFHCSDYSDVIVRDPKTFNVQKNGQEGVLQVLSIIPTSYPGHSLLTEDTGFIVGKDNCKCGVKGKFFIVTGRLPQAELRGCSDTRKI